eukprot:gene2578-6998_t
MKLLKLVLVAYFISSVQTQTSEDEDGPSEELVYQDNTILVGPLGCQSKPETPRMNPTSLKCEACPENQEVSDDGLYCVCTSQSRIVSGASDISYYDPSIYAPIVCLPCPSNQLPSLDKMFCVDKVVADAAASATKNNNGDLAAGTSSASEEQCYGARLEQNLRGDPVAEGLCIKCNKSATQSEELYSAGFHHTVNADGAAECLVCSSPHSSDRNGDGNCQCDEGYTKSNGRCFRTASIQTDRAYNVEVTLPDEGTTIQSKIISELLPAAYASCYYSVRNHIPNNETACQVLANLCVLQQYARTVVEEGQGTNACDKYLSLMASQLVVKTTVANDVTGTPVKTTTADYAFAGGLNGIAEWPVELPWLYYAMRETVDEDSGEAAGFPLAETSRVIPPTYETDIKMKGSFSAAAGTGGKVAKLTFKVAVHNLYGRFLGFFDLSEQVQRCKQSMVIRDAWLNFGTPLTSSCKLRFEDFPFQAEAGMGGVLFYDPYLVDVDDSGTETFYPVPVLNNDYEHFPLDGAKININAENLLAQGRLLYTRRFFLFDNVSTIGTQDSFASKARVASSISMAIRLRAKADGGIYPPVLTIDYATIDVPAADAPVQNEFVDFAFSASYSSQLNGYEMRLQACMVIFITLSITFTYNDIRAARERNGDAAVDEQYIFPVVLSLVSAFATSIFVILVVTGVFFLVFSKTQGSGNSFILPPQNDEVRLFEIMVALGSCMKLLHVVGLIVQQSTHDIFFIDWEHPRSAARRRNRKDANDEDRGTETSEISAWRRLFVANEWNELQVEMQVPTPLLLIIVLLFLYAADAKALATPSPVDVGPGYVEGIQYDDSKILRFAVASVLFLPIGIAMWIFNRAVYSRLVVDTMGMFEDLCAMSNISVMVLTHKCHGYYIHGQSVHEFADVSLHNLREQIWKESTDRTARRGMVESSDHQTFQIHVPQTLRDQWDKLLDRVNQDQSAAAGRPSDETARAYAKLNSFFTTFIRKGYDDQLSWVIKKQKYQDVFMSLTPRIVRNRAIFYEDNLRLYTQSLLWGQTGTLLINLFMMFAFVDWFTQNWVYATIVTYFVDQFIVRLKSELASNNLSRKALVDKAFML